MDIRELLEQRKRELYGYDSDDISLENYGDISGDDDDYDDYIGDVTLESDYDTDETEYFSDDELRQIDIMASMIDDPDEFIDEAIEEASVGILEFVGEAYINDLVFEDALFDCNSLEELEVVQKLHVIQPNVVTDIFKVRSGEWNQVRIWSYIDLGTMRKQDLFITDSRLEPINDFFDGFDVEAVTSDWEDGVMAEVNQFLTELNNKLKEG